MPQRLSKQGATRVSKNRRKNVDFPPVSTFVCWWIQVSDETFLCVPGQGSHKCPNDDGDRGVRPPGAARQKPSGVA
jgi:hypothetical protein